VQRGIDYEPLREALKTEDYLKADDIHRKKLIEVAGEAAQERGWVYFSEVCDPLSSQVLWSQHRITQPRPSTHKRIHLFILRCKALNYSLETCNHVTNGLVASRTLL
jgi:hypothetical protein